MRAALCAGAALAMTTLGALGCGGGSSGPADELLAEMDALARGPNRAIAISTALVSAGSLQPTAPDDTILTGVAGRITTETAGCGKVTQVPGMLSATFSNCALQTGVVTLSGNLTMTVSHDGSRIILVTNLDGTVDGETWKGELAVDTTDGNVYNVTAIAALGGHSFTVRSVPAAAQDGAASITTNGTTPAPMGDPRSLIYTSVGQRFSACHAGSGTLELSSPPEAIDRTLTFSDITPQTGEATWTENGNVTTVTLPHLAFCPPLPPS
jgi:hypothetical protein